MPINNSSGIEHYFTRCSIPKSVLLVANVPKLILNVNLERMYAVVINGESEVITLTLTDIINVKVGEGIPLFPFGSYEINKDNLHRGKVSAICSKNAELICFECVR